MNFLDPIRKTFWPEYVFDKLFEFTPPAVSQQQAQQAVVPVHEDNSDNSENKTIVFLFPQHNDDIPQNFYDQTKYVYYVYNLNALKTLSIDDAGQKIGSIITNITKDKNFIFVTFRLGCVLAAYTSLAKSVYRIILVEPVLSALATKIADSSRVEMFVNMFHISLSPTKIRTGLLNRTRSIRIIFRSSMNVSIKNQALEVYEAIMAVTRPSTGNDEEPLTDNKQIDVVSLPTITMSGLISPENKQFLSSGFGRDKINDTDRINAEIFVIIAYFITVVFLFLLSMAALSSEELKPIKIPTEPNKKKK